MFEFDYLGFGRMFDQIVCQNVGHLFDQKYSVQFFLISFCEARGSTCLSRSLSGRLAMDLIGVANELHLGMSKFSDGRKVPHAWLVEPNSGKLFTPGLTPNAGVPLTQL